MKPMKFLLSLSLVVILTACNVPSPAAPTPAEDLSATLEAARTQAVQTAIAALPTPAIPTPILLPTNTPAENSPTPPPTA
ncbi:MAG: hypothetical protein AB1453_11995, partial [Chloroflexota bacterium]